MKKLHLKSSFPSLSTPPKDLLLIQACDLFYRLYLGDNMKLYIIYSKDHQPLMSPFFFIVENEHMSPFSPH